MAWTKTCTTFMLFLLLHTGPYCSETAITISKHQLEDDVKLANREPIRVPGQGAPTGIPFDEVADLEERNISIVGIHSLNISYGDVVNSIQVNYTLANGSRYIAPIRGIPTTTHVTIHLNSIEHIMLVQGKTNGSVINELTITTLGPDYEKRVYGPFGKPGPVDFSMQGYIFALHGMILSHLTNLGVYSLEELTKSDEYGNGRGGEPFDDYVDVLVPPVLGIINISIWYGDFINGIQANYKQLGGAVHIGKVHGSTNASVSATVKLEEGEVFEFVEMQTATGDGAYLSQITFYTKRKDGNRGVYGPFGRDGANKYSHEGNIMGFYGHDGLYIDRLGFYYIN